jgi:hypothetical protein
MHAVRLEGEYRSRGGQRGEKARKKAGGDRRGWLGENAKLGDWGRAPRTSMVDGHRVFSGYNISPE